MMELIKEIFLQNAFASLKAAVVIVFLFILTKPITKRYTAGFRYYSWLLVMIIFLIPFSKLGMDYQIDLTPITANVQNEMRDIKKWYTENMPVYSVTEEYNSYKRVENPESEEAEYVPVVKVTTVKKQIDITMLLSVIWLFGAFLYFVIHFARYIGFKRGLRRLSRDIADDRIYAVLEQEKQRLGISKKVSLKLFPAVDTPLLTGIFSPEIIFPHTGYTDEELHLILRHELFHLKRKDILYQFVTLVFVSLHWFNPIIHIMAKAIEADGETSCDEKTLEEKSYDEKIFYGEMLLKFLKTTTQKKSYMTTTFFGGKKGMKKRLTLITDKNKRRKGTAAMAAVMIIALIISTGAAAMGNEYLDSVFEGDTSYLADFVKTEKKSVEDDRFKLTLEQYLVAENQAMIFYSFEAKTEDAVKELNSQEFWGMDTVIFGPTDHEKASCRGYGGYGTGEYAKKYNTENKIYGTLVSDNIQNDEKIDFYLSTNKIEGLPKIIIPMDYNMETKETVCGDITVSCNPISIRIERPYPSIEQDDCDWCEWDGTYFYFRMKDGEIKTFSQLYRESGGSAGFDENGKKTSWEFYAWAKEIIEPDEIKSIIVNDTEYPVDNPENPKPVTIDEHIKPFVINAYVKDHLWIPLREFCNGLGAEIKWDDETQSAEVKYRGSVYVFTTDSTQVKIDGETVDFYNYTTFIDEYGRMMVAPSISEYMDVELHGMNMNNEDGSLNKDAMWHVIP